MNLKEIVNIVNGEVITNHDTDLSFIYAFASDLMSDVLTLNKENVLLITGLSNLQIIRTAEVVDIKGILLVRNKKPTNEMIELAKQAKVTLITSPFSMFHVCGLLYKEGLKPIF